MKHMISFIDLLRAIERCYEVCLGSDMVSDLNVELYFGLDGDQRDTITYLLSKQSK